MVLLDLQEAFDMVNHKNMLQKPEATGLYKSAIVWFKSYLYEWQQSAELVELYRKLETDDCHVVYHKGQFWGPLLFLIHIDEYFHGYGYKLILYADDSALLVLGKTPNSSKKLFPQSMRQPENY